MTRGTLYLVSSHKEWARLDECSEFNGDMYPTGHYENAVKGLQAVKNHVDFYKMVFNFDKEEGFNYQDEGNGYFRFDNKLIFSNQDKDKNAKFWINNAIEMGGDNSTIDYFDYWFSDYVFFKVIGNTPIAFRDTNGIEIIVQPDEVIVFNYGRFMSPEEYKEQYKHYSEN